jgi:hypothetical protein
LVVLIAVTFQFWQLGQLPPGLNRDAAAKGLHALKWLRSGRFPFWLPHASAPEPLMVWIEGATVAMFGSTVNALSGVSAGAMVLATLAAYGLGNEVGRAFDEPVCRRVGLFAGLALASNVVVSELGRSGLRATLLSPVSGFALWALLIASRTRRQPYFVLAGLLLGLAAYTYLAARVLPIVLAIFFSLLWRWRPDLRLCWRGVVLMLGVATLLILPQLIFFARFPTTFLERAGGVSLTSNPLYTQVGLGGVLAQKLWGWLLMFGVQWSGQYNQSARPLLAPLAFVGFLLALPMLARRLREPAPLLLSLTLPLMLLPDLVGGDRPLPHEMRVMGVVVPACVLSGIGLAWLSQRLAAAWQNQARSLVAPGLAIGLVVWGAIDLRFFVAPRWHTSNYAWYARSEVAVAEFVNASDATILLSLADYSRSPVMYLNSQRVHRVQGSLDSTGQVHLPTADQVLFIELVDAGRLRPEGISYYADSDALVLIEGDTAWLMPSARAGWRAGLEQFEQAAILTPIGQLAARVYALPFERFGFPTRIRPQWEVAQAFAGNLHLWGVSASQETLESGSQLAVTSYWQTLGQVRGSFRYFVHLLDDRQQLRATEDVMPAYGAYETDEWRTNEIIPLRQLVTVPRDLAPGRYWLEVGLYDLVSGERATGPQGDRALVGPLKVPLAPVPPDPDEIPLDAEFENQVALRGYQLSVDRQQHVGVRLRWEAIMRPALDYTIFVHLENSTSEMVAQADAMPLEGAYPTGIWDPGEFVPTTLTVVPSSVLPPGQYRVWVGLYDWQTGARLPVVADGRTISDNRLLLETLTLP